MPSSSRRAADTPRCTRCKRRPTRTAPERRSAHSRTLPPMKVGLQICSFTWPGGPEAIAPTLARIVQQADEIGFDSIWVMDHYFQIRGVGRPEEPMLEGMMGLGFLAEDSRGGGRGV